MDPPRPRRPKARDPAATPLGRRPRSSRGTYALSEREGDVAGARGAGAPGARGGVSGELDRANADARSRARRGVR